MSAGAVQESIRYRIRRVIRGLSGSVTFGIPDVTGGTINVDPKEMMSDVKKELEDIEDFYDANKPILQEGIELIEHKLLKLVKKPESNEELKLVVFIDDLDRRTPEKATQILESIKVFFDIRGIVFVLGLSRSVVEAAINHKYKHFQTDEKNQEISVEKRAFRGEDYLKK
ncbi:MAG TPA: P-loop NTPase fold protein [Candidatus Nitrosotenuis sp.]|nr:P-loop NTPase fold protein [Candidatus Nitrosotenuis sp.]